MTQFAIQVTGIDRIRSNFEKAPQLTAKELNTAIHRSALLVQRTARQEAPVDRGALRSSIGITFSTLQAKVGATARYALDVHEGRKPGPIDADEAEAIRAWARRKGLPGYAVVNSIRKKGTRANPFMKRAADISQPQVQTQFDMAIRRVVEALS